MSIEFRRNTTCPSANEVFAPPPAWALPAARVLSSVVLIGCHAVTIPCDWWWTQVNELHPSLSVLFPHQLWLMWLLFSITMIVLLVPSRTSAIRMLLIR